MNRWTIGHLGSEVEAQLARTARLPGVVRMAVMPDVHVGSQACVGTVVATDGIVYPHLLGGDLGCGMFALGFSPHDHPLDRLRAARVLAALIERVPAHCHRSAAPARPTLPAELVNDATAERYHRLLQRDGQAQFGTLGGGNHFLELQRDRATDRLWLMVHTLLVLRFG